MIVICGTLQTVPAVNVRFSQLYVQFSKFLSNFPGFPHIPKQVMDTVFVRTTRHVSSPVTI